MMLLRRRVCNTTANVKLEDHPILTALHCVCNILVTHFKERGFLSGKRMNVAEHRVRWRAVVLTGLNVWFLPRET